MPPDTTPAQSSLKNGEPFRAPLRHEPERPAIIHADPRMVPETDDSTVANNPHRIVTLPPVTHVFNMLDPRDVKKLNALSQKTAPGKGVRFTQVSPDVVVGDKLIRVVTINPLMYIVSVPRHETRKPARAKKRVSKH